MTIIKINAITVPDGARDELAQRFAARAGAVDDQEGFEGFELLRPTDGRNQWLVVTRWHDEEAFQRWVGSPGFPNAAGRRRLPACPFHCRIPGCPAPSWPGSRSSQSSTCP